MNKKEFRKRKTRKEEKIFFQESNLDGTISKYVIVEQKYFQNNLELSSCLTISSTIRRFLTKHIQRLKWFIKNYSQLETINEQLKRGKENG